jgi:hypothetical protein
MNTPLDAPVLGPSLRPRGEEAPWSEEQFEAAQAKRREHELDQNGEEAGQEGRVDHRNEVRDGLGTGAAVRPGPE